MDKKEECRSILSNRNTIDNKRKTWELDEVREPLILISTTKIYHMGVSYPPGCPITKGTPTKVQYSTGTRGVDRDHKSADPSRNNRRLRTMRDNEGNKSLVGTADENHRGQLFEWNDPCRPGLLFIPGRRLLYCCEASPPALLRTATRGHS